MYRINYDAFPTARQLRPIIQSLPKQYLDLFTIDLYQIGGEKKHDNGLALFEQFEAYYADYRLRNVDERTNEILFLNIFNSQIPYLEKYATYLNTIKDKIKDFDNTWVTVSQNTGNNTSSNNTSGVVNNTNAMVNNQITHALAGASDNNSGEMLLKGFNGDKDLILFNSLNKTSTGGDNYGLGVNNTSSINSTTNVGINNAVNKSSNLSEDFRTFLNMDYPDFRNQFFSKFRPLFFVPV